MSVRSSTRLAILTVLALVTADAALADWYSRGHGRPPVGNRVYVCHGYDCRIVTPVQLSKAEVAKIAGKLKSAKTPAAERKALDRSVQVFERIVGKRVGTSGDLAGMQFGRGTPDQMDCIDEATNTTSLLRLLAANGYLKHHDIKEPAARGFFIDGRYPHATAVVAERGTGRAWAIDSWPRANAEPPVIQPLSEWRRARGRDVGS